MSRVRIITFAALCVAAALAAYGPALRAGFFWDDDVFITQNPQMHSSAGLVSVWSQPALSPHYYPVLLTVFWCLEKFFGNAAAGYHLVNILLHASNAVLVFLLGRRLQIRGARAAALFFLLHPINVQSVAWITETKNTLSTLFMLSGCLVWAAGAQGKPPRLGSARWWVVAVFFVMAMLTKSTSIVMLLVIFLIDRLRGCSLRTGSYGLSLAPLLVAGLAFVAFSASFERSLVSEGSMPVPAFWEQLGLASWSIFFYLGKLFWPSSLAPVYAMPSVTPAWASFWCAGLVALIAAAWIFNRRGNPRPLSMLALFIVFLFPIPFLGIQFTRWYGPVADHFAYVPSVVFCLAVAGCSWPIVGDSVSRVRIFVALAAAICVVFGLLTFRYAEEWRTGRVWETAAFNAPDSLAVLNYAGFLAANGRGQDALPLLQTLYAKLGQKSFVAQAYGAQLAAQGRVEEAERVMREGLRQNPGDLQLWRTLGTMLVNAGRPSEAVDPLLKSLPANPANRIALTAALVRAGRLEDARAEMASLPEPTSADADALAELAADFSSAGAYAEAENILSRILRRLPLDQRARFALAFVLLEAGKIGEAHEQFVRVIEFQPDNASVIAGLAECLQRQGRSDKAAAILENALRNFPTSDTCNAYAWFLATCPDARLRDPGGALQQLRQIPEPQLSSSCYYQGTLAAALAAAARYEDAIAAAARAIALGEKAGDKSFVAGTRDRLELYRAGRPYVLPVTNEP